MDKRESILHLITLHKTLDKLMGKSVVGSKYKNALVDAVKSLSSKEIELESSKFTVTVIDKHDDIIIDVYFTDGGLINTHKYCADCLVDENNIGEA